MLKVFFCSFLLATCSTSALSINATESSSVTTSVNGTVSQSSTSTDAPSTSTTATTSTTTSNSSPSGTTTTTTATTPTQTLDGATAADFATISTRRLSNLIDGITDGNKASGWISTLNKDTSSPDFGKWPDVDYTTGCAAQRANWPAQTHWSRIVTMAGSWRGGVKNADNLAGNETLLSAVSIAMDWWFSHDFTNPACLDSGGTDACPCSDTETAMFNTNWFSNIIGTPKLVSSACLIINDTLTETQLSNCTNFAGRSFATFNRSINGVGQLTGANTLDVATIGLNLALLTRDVGVATEAYERIHNELQTRDTVEADGIRADGSFGQHAGIIYNGNYGKDYANDLLDIEREAAGTQFAANETSRTAFSTFFEGSQWMIYYNTITKILHWDFSVIGRMISFPVSDDQASASIKISLDKVEQLGQQWEAPALTKFAESLSKASKTANAGELTGNRVFYTNDYSVHRGEKYVSTLRMYSSRTQNTECTNSQNPFGFHLADGASYLYLKGDEYEDIAGAQDWNLIPGITVDYGANTLDCSHTRYTGKEQFVGGVSTGSVGISAMRFTSPRNATLHFQKAWFFLENDVQHVMIAGINSTTSAPVYSVLDQKRHRGTVYVNGLPITQPTANATNGVHSLWHDQVGYAFDPKNDITLSVQTGNKTSNWSAIGISKVPQASVDLFAAWFTHNSLNSSVSYTVFPAADYGSFQYKMGSNKIQQLRNDVSVSALLDPLHQTLLVVFWDSQGGRVDIPATTLSGGPRSLSADGNVAVVYNIKTGDVTVADPSQQLTSVNITVSFSPSTHNGRAKTLAIPLPQGGIAGSSATQNINSA